MKQAILALTLAAYVAVSGYDYTYGNYDYEMYDYYNYDDYYYNYVSTKCEIKPWTKKHTCPKFDVGQCAKFLLKDEKNKRKRGKQMKKLKEKLRNNWCPHPGKIANGKVTLKCACGLHQYAIASCNDGYKLKPKGSKKRQCQLNKQWSKTKPECKAVCDTPTPPENGRVYISGKLEGSTATYTCDLAYTLTGGSQERTCQNNRTWSGEAPTCSLVDCGTLPDPYFGKVTQTGTKFESVTRYSCNVGYKLIPGGPCERRCLSNGAWSGTTPTCVRECGVLAHPDNGRVTQSGTLQGDTASYECGRGFILAGSKERKCQASGSWDGQPAACIPVDCGILPHPQFGKAMQTGTRFEDTTSYSCDDNYRLSTEVSCERRCLSDGKWSGSKPECIRVIADCGTPAAPENGLVDVNETTENSTAIFACMSDDYELVGSKERTCQINGNWSGSPATCVPKWCNQEYYGNTQAVLPSLAPDCQANVGGCRALKYTGANGEETNRICRPVTRKENVTCSFTSNGQQLTETISFDVVDKCMFMERESVTIIGRVYTIYNSGQAIGVDNAELSIANSDKTFSTSVSGEFTFIVEFKDFKNNPKSFPDALTITASKSNFPSSMKIVPIPDDTDEVKNVGILLISPEPPYPFNPARGTTVFAPSGVKVNIPANIVFKDSEGNTVTGPVNLNFASVDPAKDNIDNLPVKLETPNGEPLDVISLFYPSFTAADGKPISPSVPIVVTVPENYKLFAQNANGELEEVATSATRKKRQAAQSNDWQLGPEYINKWISIAKISKNTLCFFKTRVFTNDSFIDEVPNGQKYYVPNVIMKIIEGSTVAGYARNYRSSNTPNTTCWPVYCNNNNVIIRGEIMLLSNGASMQPVPQNHPALPSALSSELSALNYTVDPTVTGRIGLVFKKTNGSTGIMFTDKSVCENAPTQRSLWFATPALPPTTDNFGNDTCYLRMSLRFKVKGSMSNFTLSATSFPGGDASVTLHSSDMVSNARKTSFVTCVHYKCSTLTTNTTVVWSVLPPSTHSIRCSKAIVLTPPVINTNSNGYFYGTGPNDSTVEQACLNVNMSTYFQRAYSFSCSYKS